MVSTNAVRALTRRASVSARSHAPPTAARASARDRTRTRKSPTKTKIRTTKGTANSAAAVTTRRATESLIASPRGESDGGCLSAQCGLGFGKGGVRNQNGVDARNAEHGLQPLRRAHQGIAAIVLVARDVEAHDRSQRGGVHVRNVAEVDDDDGRVVDAHRVLKFEYW